MNILQAKDEITKTVMVYLTKDKYDSYVIPYMKQRPIFMIGAPGIGKTAIVEQVSQELDISLVAYSMTHHTRQSAIGLPYIVPMEIDGEEARISEYTISEIIASVYKTIRDSGKENGILFLDEINCVSETLAPSILQFLQYKTFGNHSLPEGWIIVAAGNPTRYNRSVREFDIATKDRLKYVVVEESYDAWKDYAHDRRVHGVIMAFLEVNKEWFYSIKASVEHEQFATARGWEDLSYMIKHYENLGFEVNLDLILQYITDEDIARKFSVFYELYQKYRDTYKVEEILEGKADPNVKKNAKKAHFDERLALVEMITDALNEEFSTVLETQVVLEGVAGKLRILKRHRKEPSPEKHLMQFISEIDEKLTAKKIARSLSQEEERILKRGRAMFMEYKALAGEGFGAIKKAFDKKAKKQAKAMEHAGNHLESAFAFMDDVWVSGREITFFTASLTSGKWSSSFIAQHGSAGYQNHSDNVMMEDIKYNLKISIDADLTEGGDDM